MAELLRSTREIAVQLAFGIGSIGDNQTPSGDPVSEIDRTSGPFLERFALEADGTPLLSMSTRPGGHMRLDRFDSGHPVYRELFPEVLKRTPAQEMRKGELVRRPPQGDRRSGPRHFCQEQRPVSPGSGRMRKVGVISLLADGDRRIFHLLPRSSWPWRSLNWSR